jgi:hypothetical protein
VAIAGHRRRDQMVGEMTIADGIGTCRARRRRELDRTVKPIVT